MTFEEKKARCDARMKELPFNIAENIKLEARRSLVRGQTIAESHPLFPVLVLRVFEQYERSVELKKVFSHA